jgi:inner membrane protein
VDNITHSLFGATVSETLWVALPESTKRTLAPQTRRALFLASVFGNNLPDFDFLYAPLMHANPQLGNLLHHRGHTHTVPIALLQGLLMLGICAFFQHVLTRFHFTKEWKWISWMAFLAPLTHITLDFLNNYGVHPFWPIDNTWKYGDWVFVLEPWAWATLTPLLFLLAPTKKGKTLYATLAILGLTLSWGLGVVPSLMCSVLTAWTLFILVTLFLMKDRGRVILTWSALATLLLFFELGNRSTLKIAQAESSQEPQYKLIDPILSPLPVNPLCWVVVSVEQSETHLRLKRRLVAPFPSIINHTACSDLRFFGGQEPTELLISITEVKTLRDQFCDVRDFLQFSRAPYFWKDETGLYFSDLRFERVNRKGFARIKVGSRTPPCASSKAPWTVGTLPF